MTGSAFISYRHEDSPAAARLIYDRLLAKLNRTSVFIDVHHIPLGVDFTEVIGDRVGSCDALVAVIGRKWVEVIDDRGHRRLDDEDDFVRIEIEAALQRDVRLIPVLVDGARMPRAGDLPAAISGLARRNALEVSHASFESDVGRLVQTLRDLPAQKKPKPSVGKPSNSDRTRRDKPQPAARIQTTGQALGFVASVKHVFANYTTFTGRASRSEYWWWFLFETIVSLIALMMDAAIRSNRSDTSVGVFSALASLALLIPSISVATRRLHDVNRSGWWQLMSLTVVGVVPLLMWLCTPGDASANEHGPNPLT